MESALLNLCIATEPKVYINLILHWALWSIFLVLVISCFCTISFYLNGVILKKTHLRNFISSHDFALLLFNL